MKLSKWAESLAIMAKYGDEDNVVQAYHDEIVAGPDVVFSQMTEADAARLRELDWDEDPNGGFAHFT